MTKKQQELFPQLMMGYLQRNPEEALKTILSSLDPEKTDALYATGESSLRDMLKAQETQLTQAREEED